MLGMAGGGAGGAGGSTCAGAAWRPLRSVEEILEILDASISRGNTGIRKSGEIFAVTANNDDQAEVLP
jgi:hypothetical protein